MLVQLGPPLTLMHALDRLVKLRMDLSMGSCSKSFQVTEELLLDEKYSYSVAGTFGNLGIPDMVV